MPEAVGGGCAQNTPDLDHEDTTDPLVVDVRNLYKVEKWTRDGTKVDSLLYAAKNLSRYPTATQPTVQRPAIRVLSPPPALSNALPYELGISAPLRSSSSRRNAYTDAHSLRIRQSYRSLRSPRVGSCSLQHSACWGIPM
jgi:hypothetical protein